MAFAKTTAFEVRPGGGSDSNGGGFDSAATGTDFSQQASAQIAYTDLVIDGTTNTKCTSAAHPFDSTSPGNIINITGGTGFTVQRVQVLSVVAGVATCDKSLGTLGSTGGTGNLGGCLASYRTAEALLVAGNTCWIKADGTDQTITTTIACTNTGDMTSGPITVQGYHTTRGDHDGTRPVIKTSTNSLQMITDQAGVAIKFRVFDNLQVTSSAVTPGYAFTPAFNMSTSTNWTISNCKFSGLKSAFLSDNSIAFAAMNHTIVGCEVTSCADAINVANSITIFGCYLHGNTGAAVKIASNAGGNGGAIYSIRFCVMYSNANGINVTSAASSSGSTGPYLDINACDIVSNTGDGIANAIASGNFSMLGVQNTILYGNGGYGVNLTNSAAEIVVNRNNAYGSNTSGARNNLAAGTNDVTLTADPFTAKAANDFSLNSTAGGGAACKAAGYPGSIPGLVASGAADIGALQSAAIGAINLVCSPRRIYYLPPARVFRRRDSGAAILPPPIIINSPRKVR